MKKYSHNVDYIKFTPDFLKYLKISKGIITLAGHKTLCGALVYQKPILCYPIEDHVEQVLNAYSLREFIQVSHKSTLKVIRTDLRRFLKEIKILEKKVKKLNVSNNGSEQIAKIIQSIAKK